MMISMALPSSARCCKVRLPSAVDREPGADGSLPGVTGSLGVQKRRRASIRTRTVSTSSISASLPSPSYPPLPRSPQGPAGSEVKVVVSGCSSPLSLAAIRAITAARGVRLVGAVDPNADLAGRDVAEVAGLSEASEVPIVSDIVMVAASVAQSQGSGVLLDFSEEPRVACENARQAGAFGLSSVIVGCALDEESLQLLSEFCDKASLGCVVAPSLSLASLIMQQAAVSLAFHFSHVQIIESHAGPMKSSYPSQTAQQLASDLSEIGKEFNAGDYSTDFSALGAVLGEGVRVHSMAMPGLLSGMEVRFSSAGQTLSLRHDITSLEALMPGLLLAIRRVGRLKNLIYGLEKLL